MRVTHKTDLFTIYKGLYTGCAGQWAQMIKQQAWLGDSCWQVIGAWRWQVWSEAISQLLFPQVLTVHL